MYIPDFVNAPPKSKTSDPKKTLNPAIPSALGIAGILGVIDFLEVLVILEVL